MKKVLMFMALAGCMILSTNVYAQSPKEIAKNRAETTKYAKKELDQKSSKLARKEAKKMAKQGWATTPGALPLEKQLDRSYLMQSEYDESGYQRYIMGEAMSIGEIYDAAKLQAMELAKNNLASQLQSELEGGIKVSLGNKQLSTEEAASIASVVSGIKDIVSQKLGRIIPVVEAYRKLENGNTEVLMRVAYNKEMAEEVAKQAVRDELKKESEDLLKKFDEATK